MFNQETLHKEILKNPTAIQSIMLEELQNRFLGGETIVDGNNTAVFLLEMNSSLVATAGNVLHDTFSSIYPVRANTSRDLYKHMSTYDYVNMLATPSTTDMGLFLNKQYLVENALPHNDIYNKVVIPDTTIFNIDSYKFGIHYPIEIRINKTTEDILVTHIVDDVNPLYKLAQNTIPHEVRQVNGILGLFITIPVHQFVKTTYVEDINNSTGFNKSYAYNDKFYAARISKENDDKTWSFIDQTLTDEIYNAYQPTAAIQILEESRTINVRIPQVYFDRKMLGSRLRVELYTTLGELDLDISGVDPSTYGISFKRNTEDKYQKYTAVLDHIPTIYLVPKSTKLQGGGNGYDFEELRSRVINDSFYTDVLISNTGLSNYFEDMGFDVYKHRDDVTERMYYCRKILTNSAAEIIAAGDIPIFLNEEIINATQDSGEDTTIIRSVTGDAVTILPTTLFKLNNGVCIPVSFNALGVLNNLTPEDYVAHMNDVNNVYTNTPFHIRLDKSSTYPMAYSYDLMDPTINSIEFVGEDPELFTQITIGGASVVHNNNGSGGYTVELNVYPSDNLATMIDEGNIDLSDQGQFRLLIKYDLYHVYATYMGIINGNHKFTFNIDVDYKISREHTMSLMNFENNVGVVGGEIGLDPMFTVIGYVRSDLIPVGNKYLDIIGFTGLTEHSIQMNLGKIVTSIYNGVQLHYDDIQYERYAANEFLQYEADEYERDGSNNYIYTVVGGDVVFNIIHKIGDWIFDVPLDRTSTGGIIEDGAHTPSDLDVVTWSATTVYEIGQIYNDGSNYHVVTTAGTSSNTEPVWESVVGDTNVDDTVVWTVVKIGTTMELDSVAGISIDASGETKLGITGPGVATSTFITDITGTTITLSKTVIGYSVDDTSVVVGEIAINHVVGTPKLDGMGNPIPLADPSDPEVTVRNTSFRIESIQIDRMQAHVESVDVRDYMTILTDNIRSYTNSITATHASLLSNTKPYFKPTNTIGSGKFKIDSLRSFTQNLQISVSLKIMIDTYTNTSEAILERVREQALVLIDEQLSTGNVNLVNLSDELKRIMPEVIKYVDVLGIDGDITKQTLIPLDKHTIPSLRRKLVLNSVGEISTVRDLNITFITI